MDPAGGIDVPLGAAGGELLGGFALGFLMRFLLGANVASPDLRAALTIGFCGAFTTMSTFSYETVALLQDGEHLRVAGYVFGTLLGGVAAVLGGMALGGRLL